MRVPVNFLNNIVENRLQRAHQPGLYHTRLLQRRDRTIHGPNQHSVVQSNVKLFSNQCIPVQMCEALFDGIVINL